jgi:DNA mismatch repair protein MutL
MAKISILPVHLVNKIAAGEVIERPASVVKELVENALDAGAGRIAVAVEDGGARLISVTDDGSGMGAEDLALAFAPHATSKIAGEDDLFRIVTMGFRGEALASIASIAHASIRTARRDEPSGGGWEVEASGEAIGQVRPCAAPPGTTVAIRDLFYSTPARRKFMKSATTEMGHITEQITRLALPRPQVAFTLTHNGRTVLDLPAAPDTAGRAADLFGRELADGLVEIVPRGRRPVRVGGLIGKPSAARPSARWQYTFLNGRYIRDRLLAHAVKEAYRGVVDPSRWPVALVFIEMDPAEVDVNVHPTKVEVRFRDSQAVHGELLAAMRETLNSANLSPDASFTTRPADLGPDPFAAALPATAAAMAAPALPDDARRTSVRQALADFFRAQPPPQPRLGFAPSPAATHPAAFASSATATQPHAPATTAADSAGAYQSEHGPAPAPAAVPAGAMQVHDSYIVVQTDDGLAIIDQHALHERLIYNELRGRLAAGGLTGQRMLIPQTVAVSPAQAAAAASHAELLRRLGVELEPFGPATLAIQQFPSMLAQRGCEPTEFVQETLERLLEDPQADSEVLLERLLQTLACKAAIKAGDPLTPQELAALLARRDSLADKGSSCPHGRPTTLKLTLKDLQKQFKRV